MFDVESIAPIVEGKNAVVSCLGFHEGTFFSPTTLYSESITPITSAMERYLSYIIFFKFDLLLAIWLERLANMHTKHLVNKPLQVPGISGG